MDAKTGVTVFLVIWTLLLLALAWAMAPALVGILSPVIRKIANISKGMYYEASLWSFRLKGIIPQ